MTAVRRMIIKASNFASVALALMAASPVAAQDADAPVDVTAAPAPSAETVGPSQLRDFTLNGTVTRPAERPAPATAAPVTVPPRTAAVPPAVSATGGSNDRVGQAERRPAASPQSASVPDPGPALPDLATSPIDPSVVSPSTPTEVATESSTRPSSPGTHIPIVPPVTDGAGFAYWPWLAALAGLAGGALFLARSRRLRGQRYGDPGRMAFAGLAPEMGPAETPVPPGRPRPDPVPPPRAQPRPDPVPPARPRPDPVPSTQPRPAPAGDGLIVSTRLKPQLDIQFVPDRAVITESEVLLQFDMVVANNGSAPARDVLVEARLVCAHAQQDQEIGLFFQNPVGKGDRIAGIAPLGHIALKSSVRLPIDQLHAFEVEGRRLFVPLVAFNILYNGEGQASASFLVGRGSEQDEKLAPFRIDLGPRIFRGLSARAHSMGLSA